MLNIWISARREPDAALSAIADRWEPGWRGTPKNGHTSHLLISFPPDTAPRDAAAIAEEMCERAFGGEKEFADDRWEYIAALHTDRSHPHVHVLVNNRGVENGSWFYLSNKLDAPFTYQGFRNLMVSVAQEYGVHLEATTRYERGDLRYSPSSAQWRQGRAPGHRALTDRVLGMLIDEADEWGEVAKAAKMVGNARVAEVATEAGRDHGSRACWPESRACLWPSRWPTRWHAWSGPCSCAKRITEIQPARSADRGVRSVGDVRRAMTRMGK